MQLNTKITENNDGIKKQLVLRSHAFYETSNENRTWNSAENVTKEDYQKEKEVCMEQLAKWINKRTKQIIFDTELHKKVQENKRLDVL